MSSQIHVSPTYNHFRELSKLVHQGRGHDLDIPGMAL